MPLSEEDRAGHGANKGNGCEDARQIGRTGERQRAPQKALAKKPPPRSRAKTRCRVH